MIENKKNDKLSDEDKRLIKVYKTFCKNSSLIMSIILGIAAIPFILEFRFTIFDFVFIISMFSASIILLLIYKRIIFFNQILEDLISGKTLNDLPLEMQNSFIKNIKINNIYLFFGVLLFMTGAISLILVKSTYYLALPGMVFIGHYFIVKAYLIWIRKLVPDENFKSENSFKKTKIVL